MMPLNVAGQKATKCVKNLEFDKRLQAGYTICLAQTWKAGGDDA
jgi:hypothetical protein